MPEDTARRLAEIRDARVYRREHFCTPSEGFYGMMPFAEFEAGIDLALDLIDALTAERDARCGNCGGDLRPVCVDCGTRHGYGWPDLPEPSIT